MQSKRVEFRVTVLLIWVLLSSLVTACSHVTDKTMVSPLVSPLPTSLCNPATPSKGAIAGRLYIGAAHSTAQPARGSVLYLGEYIGLEAGTPSVVLDVARHQHAKTADDGWFCFPEVPPGTYGLIVWDAAESILVNDPTTGLSLVIEVKAGETVDLGTLYSPIP